MYLYLYLPAFLLILYMYFAKLGANIIFIKITVDSIPLYFATKLNHSRAVLISTTKKAMTSNLMDQSLKYNLRSFQSAVVLLPQSFSIIHFYRSKCRLYYNIFLYHTGLSSISHCRLLCPSLSLHFDLMNSVFHWRIKQKT